MNTTTSNCAIRHGGSGGAMTLRLAGLLALASALGIAVVPLTLVAEERHPGPQGHQAQRGEQHGDRHEDRFRRGYRPGYGPGYAPGYAYGGAPIYVPPPVMYNPYPSPGINLVIPFSFH